jgi:hypothetical protein
MRNRGPQARRRDARAATGVVEDAHDPGRAFVAGGGEAELADELRVARRPGHGRRARVRDVREESAERDDELDVDVVSELDDLIRERPPAEVRLDSEQENRVAVGTRDRGLVEDRLRPVDAAREALLERDVRPRRLEVEELLGIEVGEPARLPALREEAERERGALRTVVPAAERGDEDGASDVRTPLDADVAGDSRSLRSRGLQEEARGQRDDAEPDRCREHDVEEHEPPRELVLPLEPPDGHLREE